MLSTKKADSLKSAYPFVRAGRLELPHLAAPDPKLQLISKTIISSIPLSTEALDKNLNAFLKKQETEDKSTDELSKSMDKKLEKATVLPNYMLMIFGISMLGLLGYFKHTANIAEKEKYRIHQLLIESKNYHYQEYFSKTPEIKDDYYKWLGEQK
ncbi:hypothetical protein JM83_0977 [Gillisia sp. Hel_I_86]|uniref:DUF6730 family protein n=1 Tax=Gillisia sp. Hel_I_86 TaxID=1249981 RepID=UPI00119B723F|nr:DUF6730 family protein [Gillisia sp. Hel_I_86]TVZ26032.1 hypothetical protein JM83_0977 [Gillisia sp. Hel_I_86]